VIGGVGVLVRRNAIVVFMASKLMLNACNLAFVAFAGCTATWTGRSSRSSSWVVAADGRSSSASRS